MGTDQIPHLLVGQESILLTPLIAWLVVLALYSGLRYGYRTFYHKNRSDEFTGRMLSKFSGRLATAVLLAAIHNFISTPVGHHDLAFYLCMGAGLFVLSVAWLFAKCVLIMDDGRGAALENMFIRACQRTGNKLVRAWD